MDGSYLPPPTHLPQPHLACLQGFPLWPLVPGTPLWHKYLCHLAELWRWLGAPDTEHSEGHHETEHGRAHEAYDLSNKRLTQLGGQLAKRYNRLMALRRYYREADATRELLVQAVSEERLADVEYLLSAKGGADPSATDEDGDAMLHVAGGHGDVQVVEQLIACGAGLEARSHEGATPLVLASINGHLEVARLLLDAGALVNSRWQHLQPAQWAAEYGRTDIVEMLVHTYGGECKGTPAGRGRMAVGSKGYKESNHLRPPPPSLSQERHWLGRRWAFESLLPQIKKEGSKGELCSAWPELQYLELKLRQYLGGAVSSAVAESMRVRPGIRLRRAKGPEDFKLRAAPTVDATAFRKGGLPQVVLECVRPLAPPCASVLALIVSLRPLTLGPWLPCHSLWTLTTTQSASTTSMHSHNCSSCSPSWLTARSRSSCSSSTFTLTSSSTTCHARMGSISTHTTSSRQGLKTFARSCPLRVPSTVRRSLHPRCFTLCAAVPAGWCSASMPTTTSSMRTSTASSECRGGGWGAGGEAEAEAEGRREAARRADRPGRL